MDTIQALLKGGANVNQAANVRPYSHDVTHASKTASFAVLCVTVTVISPHDSTEPLSRPHRNTFTCTLFPGWDHTTDHRVRTRIAALRPFALRTRSGHQLRWLRESVLFFYALKQLCTTAE